MRALKVSVRNPEQIQRMESCIMPRTAQCACGGFAMQVVGEPVAHAVCHCDNCKRRTGSAFGVSAYFRKQDVLSVTGETSIYAFHNPARNEDQERYFCKRCGTTLYWHVSTHPDFVGIAAGCFADDPVGEPSMMASPAKKVPWVTLPEHWQVAE
jgi:hypothetical protein